jgi:hypothetical protein
MAAGSIVIDLLMKTGAFLTDTGRAEKALRKLQKEAEATNAKAIAAGVAIGNGITELSKQLVNTLHDMTFGAIDAADHLNDLSKKTGIAVETIGGIGFAAGQAGGDLETAAAGAGKLNKSLAEAASGNVKAAEAFRAMGISVKDAAGNTKSADVALAEIADKFASYADGPEKAALALRIFGKAGADMIPLLDDGGTALRENIAYFKQYSGMTSELAETSDTFNDTLGKLNVQSKAFGNHLAAALLPTLQALADAFLKVSEGGTIMTAIATAIGFVFKEIATAGANVAFVVSQIGEAFGAMEAAKSALLHGNFAGVKTIFTEYRAQAIEARKALDDFEAKVNKTSATAGPATAAHGFVGPLQPKGHAPGLPGDDAAATLKKQLDGQLKAIDAFAQAQRDRFDYANRYVEGAYAAGKMSLAAYFQDQQYLREQALTAQVAQYDKEIAALKAFQTKTTSEPERIDTTNKIAEAQGKRAEAIAKAAQTEVLAEQQRQAALEQTTDRYNDLIAAMDELSGNNAGAATIRIAQQVRDAAKLVTQKGGDPALIEQYRAQLEGVAALAEQQRQYNKLLDHTQMAEDAIGYDAKLSGKTELEVLAEVRDVRAAAIIQLREQAAAARQLADSLNTDEARKRADELALAVKKATAELDPLADRLNSVFVDSFSDAFVGFIDGTKSAAQAFRDFGKAVIEEFARMAAKAAATKLFGASDSGGGGLGGLFSSLFGGGGLGNAGAGDYSNAGLAAAFGGAPAADGMNYVPYDGYRASLHRGEAVVPARYNPALGNGASGEPLKLTIVNHTSGRIDRATEQRISPTERALIIEEATENVAAQFHDPNSRVSRATVRNLNVTRKR